MQRRTLLIGSVTALVVDGPARAVQDTEQLPAVGNLSMLLAEVARRRVPLLILFSTPGCPYCLEVRRNYLAPRLAEGPNSGVIVREVDITGTVVIQGAGGGITEAQFASKYGIKAVPAVWLFDARMQPLVEPLVGLDRSGFYESSLQRSIDAARRRLLETP